MAIHPRFWPQFWVLVRNYRLLENNLLVQSPNVDLKVRTPQELRAPQIIIRAINGDYMGEPRTLEAVTLLEGDINGAVYRHAAHGVYVSLESNGGHFPLWVCLQRDERCQEGHIWALNLFNFEYQTVPISKICWVPTHEAANGCLYTVISSPGKHGYTKEMYIPTVAQEIGLPEQAKFQLLSSSLAGFTRLEPERQEALFKKQYMSIQERHKTRSRISPQQPPWFKRGDQRQPFYTPNDEDSTVLRFLNDDLSSDEESTSSLLEERVRNLQEQTTEGFCRCSCCFSDLGPTYVNPYPLHQHITDDNCNLGSSHRLHCIFAAHRLDHCVIPVINYSGEQHKHCATYGTPSGFVNSVPTPVEDHVVDFNATVDNTAIVAVETGSDDEGFIIGYLSDELELFPDGPSSSESERMPDLQDMELWSASTVLYPESRPISPMVEFLPDVQGDLGSFDELSDPAFDITTAPSTIWNDPSIFMTPEPPEICR
ncbi:hypothetical protein F4859DRAFT_185211 [Xylaria cf. heliscus]|nr:hypothetical protein F4859DRAFT_185211 [Xylaria cf. heliscus]